MYDLTKEEFEIKYKQYSQELMNVSYGYTRNKEDSLDVIQNVFYKLFKYNKTFATPADEKYWLLRVTINESKDLLRKRARTTALDESALNRLSQSSQTEQNTLELHFLAQKVKELPEKYRVVVILHYYDSLPIKEIVKILKISENAVKKRLERARNMLKKEMEDWIMFDDINKIIPKLDEKDSQTIYQNLSKKQIKSKPSFFANKFALATASVVILLFIFIPEA